jgi:hypothetical protein
MKKIFIFILLLTFETFAQQNTNDDFEYLRMLKHKNNEKCFNLFNELTEIQVHDVSKPMLSLSMFTIYGFSKKQRDEGYKVFTKIGVWERVFRGTYGTSIGTKCSIENFENDF